jgi:RNA polymerase sigma-70 factor (ECF subfamily)
VLLYDQLRLHAPTPVVELNRAVAVAEAGDPAAALTAIEHLDLGSYHLYHAARADLLTRLGRRAEAVAAYDDAIGLTANAAERELLERRRAAACYSA